MVESKTTASLHGRDVSKGSLGKKSVKKKVRFEEDERPIILAKKLAEA